MEQPNQFRSAFNGFNREDVVRYLEFINNKHSAQLAQLNNELDYLRKKQETMDTDRTSDLEAQLAELREENDTLKRRIATLEDALSDADDSMSKTQRLPNAAELEAYRRAERVERLAKERASQIGDRTTFALNEAESKVDTAADQIARITAQIVDQLSLLKNAMDGSHTAFQDASKVLAKLHSEIEE